MPASVKALIYFGFVTQFSHALLGNIAGFFSRE
jgi:hypothetical protein